ncbi:hypothetical protein SAMN05192563_100121 [Paraburkholderia aspalathi]|uniref:Uncharacterized protein n=1 Tax=Paraburkholderia aspalathi TaxID=1324617 RepID=A0A1I6XJZ6_9BURK|nr:hypothetical protein SAMN05192563_100121 [Paraburkholderia aspalathi]
MFVMVIGLTNSMAPGVRCGLLLVNGFVRFALAASRGPIFLLICLGLRCNAMMLNGRSL